MKKLKKCFLLLLVLAIALINSNTAAFAAPKNILRKISIVKVSDIELNKSATQLIAGGEKEILTVTVYPFNATNKYVTWRSSNSNVARVSNGIITPIAEGSAVITATSSSHISIKDTCTVTVTKKTEPVIPQPEPVVPQPEPFVPQLESFVQQPEPFVPQPESFVQQPEFVVPQLESIVPQPESIVPQPEPVVTQQEPVAPQQEPVVPELIINEKSVLEFKCDDGRYVKGDGIHDDTTGIQRALNSGGNISFVSDGYTYKVTSELIVPSDTVVDGKNATIKAQSSAVAKNVFIIANKQNVVIKNLKITSTMDQVRAAGSGGLSSNIYAIHISTGTDGTSNNISVSNIYGENMNFLIKVDAYENCFNRNLTFTDIIAYNCIMPIYMGGVDVVAMERIDLDQALDVSKLDHHLYIDGNSYNIDIDDIVVRRGTSAIYGNAFNIASSSSAYLENVKMTNVRAENLNNTYVFAFFNVKNCIVDGFQAELTGSTLVWYYNIHDITFTNFNVTGKIGQLIVGGDYKENEYNKSITLKNSNVDISFNNTNLFTGENITVNDNTFNLSQVSGNGTFMRIGNAAKYVIENNRINILKYPDRVELFNIRENYGADVIINNNIIKNISGVNLNFIFADYTTAEGSSKITVTNNTYSGYNSFYYVKALAYLYNNILI